MSTRVTIMKHNLFISSISSRIILQYIFLCKIEFNSESAGEIAPLRQPPVGVFSPLIKRKITYQESPVGNNLVSVLENRFKDEILSFRVESFLLGFLKAY